MRWRACRASSRCRVCRKGQQATEKTFFGPGRYGSAFTPERGKSIEHSVIEDELACDFEARHKTVIGIGKAVFVEDDQEKIAALDGSVARYTAKHFEYPKENLDRSAVIRIDIDSMKGKKHGF
jgi:hypothetical protein